MQLGWAMHSIKLSELYEAARTGRLRLGPYLQEANTRAPAHPKHTFELEASHSRGHLKLDM